MRCINCGKDIPDESKFCVHCGEEIVFGRHIANTDYGDRYKEEAKDNIKRNSEQSGEKTKNSLKAFIPAAIVLLAICIGLGIQMTRSVANEKTDKYVTLIMNQINNGQYEDALRSCDEADQLSSAKYRGKGQSNKIQALRDYATYFYELEQISIDDVIAHKSNARLDAARVACEESISNLGTSAEAASENLKLVDQWMDTADIEKLIDDYYDSLVDITYDQKECYDKIYKKISAIYEDCEGYSIAELEALHSELKQQIQEADALCEIVKDAYKEIQKLSKKTEPFLALSEDGYDIYSFGKLTCSEDPYGLGITGASLLTEDVTAIKTYESLDTWLFLFVNDTESRLKDSFDDYKKEDIYYRKTAKSLYGALPDWNDTYLLNQRFDYLLIGVSVDVEKPELVKSLITDKQDDIREKYRRLE